MEVNAVPSILREYIAKNASGGGSSHSCRDEIGAIEDVVVGDLIGRECSAQDITTITKRLSAFLVP